jgi:hypothetical protein
VGLWWKGDGRAEEVDKTMGRMELVTGMESGRVGLGMAERLGPWTAAGHEWVRAACSVPVFIGQRKVI